MNQKPDAGLALDLSAALPTSALPGSGADRTRVDITGVYGSAAARVALEFSRAGRERVTLVVCSDADAARVLAQDLHFWRTDNDAPVRVLTSADNFPYAEVHSDRRSAMSLSASLAALADAPKAPLLLCVDATALIRKLPPPDEFLLASVRLRRGDTWQHDSTLRGWIAAGYTRVPVVEDPGSYAVRGTVIDVWPAGARGPIRIELDDERIAELRAFDPETQVSDLTVSEVFVPPAQLALRADEHRERAKRRILELADTLDVPTSRARATAEDLSSGRPVFAEDAFLPVFYRELSSLFEYLPGTVRVVLSDPAAVVAAWKEELKHFEDATAQESNKLSSPPSALSLNEAELLVALSPHPLVTMSSVGTHGADDSGIDSFAVVRADLRLGSRPNDVALVRGATSKTRADKAGSLAPIVAHLARLRDAGMRTLLTARSELQASRLSDLLAHQGLQLRRLSGELNADLSALRADEVGVRVGALSSGVLLPGDGLAIVTDEDIFGTRTHRAKDKRTKGSVTRPFIEDLRALHVGDYVVHAEHGVGKYLGLTERVLGGAKIDLLIVEYAGSDKLYLPAYRLSQLQKYAGSQSAAPKLDRLGGSTFAKTKSKARSEVRKLADDLLRLYAEREAARTEPLGEAGDEYRAFEATFPYDETHDQAEAIDAVLGDLAQEKPMDRLVCGDVGFGKTEVAIRAAFRVALAGRQVAVLCPTTVLAQQHFRSFEARMAGYPLRVVCLSRFQSKKEQTEALKGVKDGTVDIVIGTHRLLSKDVHYKRLGLVVVDEEQRFGVAHKERLKQMKGEVHVLTLSATPIPRTLQLAVGGLRDLSLITTPPTDRRAVRTLVTRNEAGVIKEAIDRELSRGGQVYYVYNRVDGLYERAERIRELLPRARVAVAHGQMGTRGPDDESILEKTMLDFVDGHYDVLVATTIVESGLDIPRANTILIDRADNYGLAQLYQLRGRVGRGKERAYCYLLVPPADTLTDEARARIEAIERHTELGSGFKIASLDMELRGTGDLLGAEQSGTVSSVGFELFCRMLEDAVAELRGEVASNEVDPELSFDESALIGEAYVEDVGLRLSLYKRLASAADESQVEDIAVEMENRFGPLPEETLRFVRLMRIKTELRALRILGCEATSTVVTLHLREDTPLDPGKVLALVKKPRSPFKLTPDMRLTRRWDDGAKPGGMARTEELLEELQSCMLS